MWPPELLLSINASVCILRVIKLPSFASVQAYENIAVSLALIKARATATGATVDRLAVEAHLRWAATTEAATHDAVQRATGVSLQGLDMRCDL